MRGIYEKYAIDRKEMNGKHSQMEFKACYAVSYTDTEILTINKNKLKWEHVHLLLFGLNWYLNLILWMSIARYKARGCDLE